MGAPRCPVEETGELKAWARFEAAHALKMSRKLRQELSYKELALVVSVLTEAGYEYLKAGKRASRYRRRRAAEAAAAGRVVDGTAAADEAAPDDV